MVDVDVDAADVAFDEITTAAAGDTFRDDAHAPNKDASNECSADQVHSTDVAFSMETENRKNATINNNNKKKEDNMEAEAATKIQAGFRGYKVRKQLKQKVS